MTPDQLQLLVAKSHPGAADLLPHAPTRALALLEDAAARACEPELERALLALHDAVIARHDLPPVLAGVRLGEVVRWDAWTVTFEGSAAATGSPAMVRALRAGAVGDPLLRRALERAGRALRAVLPEVRSVGGAHPALALELPGPALDTAQGGLAEADAERQAWALGQGLLALLRWRDARLSPGLIAPNELRDSGSGVVLCCLTPSDPPDWAGCLVTLSASTPASDASPLGAIIAGLSVFPPSDLDEAEAWLREALRDTLRELHQELITWNAAIKSRDRRGRLARLCARLASAAPPPAGRGHVGVDLEGRPTVVQSAADWVGWGAVDEQPATVYTRDEGISPVLARRLLRAHAAAPPNKRLQREVGAADDHTIRLCRWLAAGLQLRTIALLLARTE